MKKSVSRKFLALALIPIIAFAFTIPVSASTPESPITVFKEYADILSSTVDKDTSYDLSALDLSTLPAYMEESLGFNELTKDKKPKSITDLYVEDLYSFTTYNEDGTLTLHMFSEPVKFVDKEASAIRFIDNTIKVSAENGSPISSGKLTDSANNLNTAKSYTNTANFFKVDMPASVNQGISLSYGAKKFTLSPATASLSSANLKTATHRGIKEQVVEYRNALGNGIHLQYIPINSGVKENIILDKYPGRNTFNFIFDAGGYYPAYTEGESIPFVDPTTDKIALILGQADAKDSYTGDETDGHFSIYNSLKVSDLGNGKYSLTITIDKDFLTDPKTVYPVIIDPTFTVPNNTVRDTTVYSGVPNSSAYYSSAYLIVGNHGSSYGEGIAFVQANHNYNLQPLFTHENIVSARYRVYEGSGKTNSSTINVGLPLYSWNQTTLNYGNKPSYTKTSSLVVSKSGWHEFNITTQAKTWVEGYKADGYFDPAVGLVLYANDSSASSKHFCSAEHSTYAPSISITYHEANMYHVNAAYGYKPFKAWGRLIDGVSPVYSFSVTTAGTYRIETLNSIYFGDNAPDFNTRLYLYDSNHNHITQSTNNNGNLSGELVHEHIVRYLDVGTYHVCVADNATYMLDVQCYLIIERFDANENPANIGHGELRHAYSMYTHTREFYKIDDCNTNINCMEYVLGVERDDLRALPYQAAKNIMAEFGYQEALINDPNLDIDNCIVSYGTNTYISHYAKIENGIVTAKLNGDLEYVMHTSYDCYPIKELEVIRFFTYVG